MNVLTPASLLREFGANPYMTAAGLALSCTTFAAALVGVPLFLVRAAPDHFVRPHPPRRTAARLLRAAVGLLVIGAGAAMLVLPGQGVLTILAGLWLLELPVTSRWVKTLLARKRVADVVNRLRARAGKPPLVSPTATGRALE